MSFGGVSALASGNPIGAALSVFQSLIGLGQDSVVYELIRKLKKLQDQFKTMQSNGLFGTQVQARKVADRSIWEEIGYAEPADVPHLFPRAPAGTTFTVKDPFYPANDFTTLWVGRRLRDYLRDVRHTDGTWWGSVFKVNQGDPSDTIPGIGREGVWRQDFPAEALAGALARQPKQYLGPRPLAGEDAASRRLAFAQAGDVRRLWLMYLSDQARREGRRVRAWGGVGWLDGDPSGELKDDKTATAYRFSGLQKLLPDVARPVRTPFQRIAPPDADAQTLELFLGRTPIASRARVRTTPTAITSRVAKVLFDLGFRSPSDFSRITFGGPNSTLSRGIAALGG